MVHGEPTRKEERMNLLSLYTELKQFTSCKEFLDEFHITKKDLIITCSYIYEDFFKEYHLEGQVIYQDKYGAGEPSDEMIDEMIADIDPSYERIFGIGGGTVMDISKLFALKQMTPLVDLFTGKIKTEKKCPLILIPTTCGTGSEVTNVSIVGFPSLDTKLRLAVNELYADEAIFIPELIKHLPRSVFATSSIDALIHGIESSLSPLATPYSEVFGHKAIEMIIHAYQQIREQGFETLDNLLNTFLIASNFAGIAFGKAGCGAVHALSYPLSGKYHVAHGEANYALLTGVLRKYAQKECSAKYQQVISILAQALNCRKENVPEELEELLSVILPKKSLKSYGMVGTDIPAFADSVLTYQQVIMSHNPTVLSKEDIMDIYGNCF